MTSNTSVDKRKRSLILYPLKENVEAAAEEAVVGSEEAAILRIGGVGVNVSRIEMVGKIKAA